MVVTISVDMLWRTFPEQGCFSFLFFTRCYLRSKCVSRNVGGIYFYCWDSCGGFLSKLAVYFYFLWPFSPNSCMGSESTIDTQDYFKR